MGGFFPATVVVEPTNTCNLACAFCQASCRARAAPRHDLAPDDLAVVLERLRGHVLNVVFQGDCEPTVSPHLTDLVRVAARHTTSVAMVSNGTLLRPALARALADAGLSWFAVSIDDHRPEPYARVRGGADLERVLDHVRGLVALRDAERPDLQVVAHKIVFPHDTVDSVKAYVRRLYLEVGVSQITFAPLVDGGTVTCPDWLITRNRVESELLAEGVMVNLREFAAYPYRTLHKYCGAHVLHVDHRGQLGPCSLRRGPDALFGDLLREPLDVIAARPHVQAFHAYWRSKRYGDPLPRACSDCFLLKGPYHPYTLNEGHRAGQRFGCRAAAGAEERPS